MKFFSVIIFAIVMSFIPKHSTAEELVTIKLVGYIGQTSKVKIELKGQYFTPDSTLLIKKNERFILTEKQGSLVLVGKKGEQTLSGPFMLFPSSYDHDHQVIINGRSYLGAMAFRLENGKYIRPFNQLPIEDYLKGVLPFEVFPTWHIETLKAQAMAARTYAYSHLSEEMDDTIKYQVYGGFAWDEAASKAVEETKNQVITYQNKLIDAFYSASNGGITETNTHVWGGKSSPFYPVKKDPYDPILPWSYSFNCKQINLDHLKWNDSSWWERTKEKDEEIMLSIRKKLMETGYPSDIKILGIPKFTLSQRRFPDSTRSITGSIEIDFMYRLFDGTIIFDKFELNNVPLKNIRPLIGGQRFKSYLIDSLDKEENRFTMKGKGYGHGVGMSQWGANVMGNNGKTYKEIIEFYYPGTDIITLSDKDRRIKSGGL